MQTRIQIQLYNVTENYMKADAAICMCHRSEIMAAIVFPILNGLFH